MAQAVARADGVLYRGVRDTLGERHSGIPHRGVGGPPQRIPRAVVGGEQCAGDARRFRCGAEAAGPLGGGRHGAGAAAVPVPVPVPVPTSRPVVCRTAFPAVGSALRSRLSRDRVVNGRTSFAEREKGCADIVSANIFCWGDTSRVPV